MKYIIVLFLLFILFVFFCIFFVFWKHFICLQKKSKTFFAAESAIMWHTWILSIAISVSEKFVRKQIFVRTIIDWLDSIRR